VVPQTRELALRKRHEPCTIRGRGAVGTDCCGPSTEQAPGRRFEGGSEAGETGDASEAALHRIALHGRKKERSLLPVPAKRSGPRGRCPVQILSPTPAESERRERSKDFNGQLNGASSRVGAE
jgi:hypothetical protein